MFVVESSGCYEFNNLSYLTLLCFSLGVPEAGKEVREMSNPQSMQQLADKFMNDADFREEMCRDPVGTAERSGLQLDDEDRQALRSIDWSGSDEELKERVSKSFRPFC
jgi:hypothetical protein